MLFLKLTQLTHRLPTKFIFHMIHRKQLETRFITVNLLSTQACMLLELCMFREVKAEAQSLLAPKKRLTLRRVLQALGQVTAQPIRKPAGKKMFTLLHDSGAVFDARCSAPLLCYAWQMP